MRLAYALLAALLAATAVGHITFARQGPLPATPILFVTQVPTPADFATIGSVFANHRGAVTDAPRGGDLWIVGSPTRPYEVATYYWQLYEVVGLGQNQTPVITKVPNPPANDDNVSPIYGADDHVIFSSDRPRDGQRHLYLQLDEYESTPVVTGLWSLDPATGDLFILNHAGRRAAAGEAAVAGARPTVPGALRVFEKRLVVTVVKTGDRKHAHR